MEPKNITSQQRELLKNLENNKENFTYEWDELRGVLSFVRADSLVHGKNVVAQHENNQQTFTEFMKTYDLLFGSPNVTDGLKRIIAKEDIIGWQHYQFQSYFVPDKGKEPEPIEFYGSKIAAHFKPDGTLVGLQSSCYREIQIANTVKVTVQQLRDQLFEEIRKMEGFQRLEGLIKRQKEELFPLMQEPRLVIYPWKEKMLNVWATYGYASFTFDSEIIRKDQSEKPVIAFGQMFFDAETGEMFLFAPTRKGAEIPTTGTGLGCTPLGGPYVNRNLNTVRVDASSTYLLKDKTKARDIITYDANADSSVVYPNIPQKISDGSIAVSTDSDGDHNWSRVAADTTDAERTASQQPEVDEHFRVAELYDWYSAIGGRVGWDDNDFSAPLVPDQTLNVVAHTYDDSVGTSRSVNAFFDKELVSGAWISHLAFFDGDPTGSTIIPSIGVALTDDYLAGSDAIVGHEYQHGVTDFSFKDGMGNPGLTYSGWFSAIHEGTSDVFGGLFSADWWMGNGISPTGQIFRNLAFPRDPSTLVNSALNNHSKDHFDDRNLDGGFRYDRGTYWLIVHTLWHREESTNAVHEHPF